MDNRRNTIQRQVVYNAVLELKNHPCAEDVYQHISDTYPSISLATVYRNLNLLAESGKLMKVSMNNSADRFDNNTHSHYHIQCIKCSTLYDGDISHLADIDNEVSSKTGFSILTHNIVFSGICPHCQGEEYI